MNRTELKCWLLFLLLNTMLFLPRYFLEFQTSSFFPRILPAEGQSWLPGTIFIRRFNYDIFRVSVDLVVMITVFFLLRKRVGLKSASFFAGIYYQAIFLFLFYFNSFENIYKVKPLLLSDFYLFGLAFHNMNGKLLFLPFLLLLLALTCTGVIRLFRYFFRLLTQVKLSKYSYITFGTIWLVYALNLVRAGMSFDPSHVFQLSAALITDNFQLYSQASDGNNRINFSDTGKIPDYSVYRLQQKPDIYLIFLESYGDILNRHVSLKDTYNGMLSYYDSLLLHSDWHVISNLSTSPVSGGKSWLAFTSVLYGTRIATQGSYLGLLKNKAAHEYSHLPKYLHNQGYMIYWLNSMPDRKEMSVPWELYTNLYGVDRWIYDRDMNYLGLRYGYGPSPPDQFSLYFARSLMHIDNRQPRFLFFITQNSHSPFHSPEKTADDWRSLNTTTTTAADKVGFLERPEIHNYLKSINYELEMAIRFMLDDTTQNPVYIILGDHQPPGLTNARSGFETPVHIFSKDTAFVSGFKNYGFRPGLGTAGIGSPVKHEALYSSILRELYRTYGDTMLPLPDFLPGGLTNEMK